MRLKATLLALLAGLTGSAAAQIPAGSTVYSFGTVLTGASEVPANASAALGVASVVYVDTPTGNPTPDFIVVRGGFDDLGSDYQMSHLHNAPAGSNGPVVVNLTATTTGTPPRGGEWTQAQNTSPSTTTFLAALQAGTIYVNVHSVTLGGGEIRGQLRPVPLLDGDLSDDLYLPLATEQNQNAGFGPDIDVSEIVYYPDMANRVLFLGVRAELNTASFDGISLWLGFSELAGAPAGDALGGTPNAGHHLGNGTNPNFKADFEVDYAFALNPGGGAAGVFLDVVKFVGGTRAADYLGSADQAGTAFFGPPDDVDSGGMNPAVFDAIIYAFSNARTATSGLEMAIPFADLGISPDAFTGADQMDVFTVVVSGDGFFSDVTVPGNVVGGNVGNNANFDTLPGGPYVASVPLIVVATEPGGSGEGAALATTPNPFRDAAALTLTLDAAQTVRAEVYDALGRRVAVLHEGALAAGAHTLALDGAALAPGVYVVRVTGETFSATQRVARGD